jgi:glutaminyl-peptide cyclotransferase
MATLEKRMRELRLFRSSPDYHSSERASYSARAKERLWLVDATKSGPGSANNIIGDDHLPFLHRGVEVLHVIDFNPSTGFPKVWHNLEDDGEHLDMNTVEDWSVLVIAFAAEWMELEGFLDPTTTKASTPRPTARDGDNGNEAEFSILKRTLPSRQTEL